MGQLKLYQKLQQLKSPSVLLVLAGLVVVLAVGFSAIVFAKKPLNSQKNNLSEDSLSDYFAPARRLAQNSKADTILDPLETYRKKQDAKQESQAKFHLKKVKQGFKDIVNICHKTNWSAKDKLNFFEQKLAYIYQHAVSGNNLSLKVSYLNDNYNLALIGYQIGNFMEDDHRKLAIQLNLLPFKRANYFKALFLNNYKYSHNLSKYSPSGSPSNEEVYASSGKWLKDIVDGLSCIQ